MTGSNIREVLAGSVAGVMIDNRDGSDLVAVLESSRFVMINEDNILLVDFSGGFNVVKLRVKHCLEGAVLVVADLPRIIQCRVGVDAVGNDLRANSSRHRVGIWVWMHQHGYLPNRP